MQFIKKNNGEIISNLTVKNFAYVEREADLFSEQEKLWNKDIENRMPDVYRALKRGDPLSDSAIFIIKKLLALHFIRSVAFNEIYEKSKLNFGNDLLKRMKKKFPKEFVVNGAIWNNDWIKRTKNAMPELLSDNIQKVEGYIASYNLEVGLAPDDVEFIIGDNPVLSVGDNGAIGILQGVPVLKSRAFGMPLSTKYFVALTSSTRSCVYIALTKKEVESVNEKQIRGCVEYYYSTPIKLLVDRQ